MGEFGEKFRKAREKKGFSFDDVSQVTKIGVRMLQAIEEEHFDRLPGGVFNKGFIRTYAKHLGLNDQEAVASYLACTRQTQMAAYQPADLAAPIRTRREAASKSAPSASRKSSKKQSASAPALVVEEELPELQLPRAEHVRPPRRENLRDSESGVPWRIVALAGVVIVLAVILWTRHSRHVHAQATPSAAKSASAASTAASASASYQTASNHGDSATQAGAASSKSGSPSILPAVGANESGAEESNSGAALASSPAKAAAPLTLVIRATENSWISVRADGQEVTEETLIAPAHTSVRATHEIAVKTGNAAGVNFMWNGQEIPAQGAEAEVKTFVFDAGGLRTLPPPPPATQNQ